MTEQKSGRIVNISSISAKLTWPAFVAYGAAKAALHAFTTALAKEVAGDGITVNCVLPGFTRTEEMERIWGTIAHNAGKTMDELVNPILESKVPIKRWLRPGGDRLHGFLPRQPAPPASPARCSSSTAAWMRMISEQRPQGLEITPQKHRSSRHEPRKFSHTSPILGKCSSRRRIGRADGRPGEHRGPDARGPAGPGRCPQAQARLDGLRRARQLDSELFRKHGGYEVHAVADYFPEVAEEAGNELGVDKARRFSGLSGYRRLIDSGVEAVAIEDVPYFYPEQAKAAVEAGLHVYMAKPVAVDVPGCLAIGPAGKEATRKQRCFLVDYQLPMEPACIEVAKRVRDGALGKLVHIVSFGIAWQALARSAAGQDHREPAAREIWLSDTALSGDTIVSYDIHIIDGILWRPGPAAGRGLRPLADLPPGPHGDRTDAPR